MLYLDSNIPSQIFYDSISSKILRIARKTADLINLVTHVNVLLIGMKKQVSEVPLSFHHSIIEIDICEIL